MYTFDKRLCALTGCPVVEEKGGAMMFNPFPIITAENDLYLAHEICHILAGKKDYDIFLTAVQARDNDDLFRHILNVLYDWYHESLYGQYSGVLWHGLINLHKTLKHLPTGIPILDTIYRGYIDGWPITKVTNTKIKDVIDLVIVADHIVEKLLMQAKALNLSVSDIQWLMYLPMFKTNRSKSDKSTRSGKKGSPKSDIGKIPKRSNYYSLAISKYFHVINELATLWKRNKYVWKNNYYGEINWKNLQGMFIGQKLNLPVWRLFQKIAMSRKIYLVVDRSGSTYTIKTQIMDTAIIIAESLRKLNIPISVLDIGVTNTVINDIKDPLDISWFTPMSKGGTPLGEVCSLVTKADSNSYLLVITDGEPNSWSSLVSALNAFPGQHLTFVIGDSYGQYVAKIKNTIHVEPHTIIREMLYEHTLT